ncbi:tRNA preQ1(34) S-adenosylmethionine ribosyltransferase-isomerase QueA [Aminivibrio sp.]
MTEPDLFSTAAYDYYLPEDRIAQNPAVPRDSSRLLVLPRHRGGTVSTTFRRIGDFLSPGDLLVLNDTRVIPPGLFARLKSTGREVEVLLLRSLNSQWTDWEALLRPGRKVRPGEELLLSDGTVLTAGSTERRRVRTVRFPPGTGAPSSGEDRFNPLPPYITRSTAPPSAYQTVFARENGSAAAPTASLHFTESLLEELKGERGVTVAWLTLHVGLGTFRPVKAEDIRDHHIHEEYCSLPLRTKELAGETKRRGGRIVAAGTTVARALESMAGEDGSLEAGSRSTRLFIYPGYRYKIIDGLITNFHLPKSSLLMLVAAFAGYERTMKAYQEAVSLEYRFFSFGDAMLII